MDTVINECGIRIVECGIKIQNPRSKIRNPKSGSLPPISNGNSKVWASQHAPITTITLNWFYCYGETILIFNQYLARTQFNTNIAPFAPLVKYLDGYPGTLAIFLFYSVLNFRLLG